MTCPRRKKVKPPRSHWDMLMERRTIADLEEVLAERLAVIRGQRGAREEPGRASAGSARAPQPAERQQRPAPGPSASARPARPARSRRLAAACRLTPHWVTRQSASATIGPAHLAGARGPAR